MKKNLLVWVLFLGAAPSVHLHADLRMVVRETFWGTARKDTALVWETVVIRQTSVKITRKYHLRIGFIDTVEVVPNYNDSVYYWSSFGQKYFVRSREKDSAFLSPASSAPALYAGVFQEKLPTDKRRIADTACEHRQWVWRGCSLDSAGQRLGLADLEMDFWLPVKGFLGKEEIEFYNQFRRKNFGGHKRLLGVNAARISSVFGIRLVELERKVKTSPIFPLELKITLRRKLGTGQREYVYTRDIVELHPDRQDVRDFMLPTGYERVKLEKRSPAAGAREK